MKETKESLEQKISRNLNKLKWVHKESEAYRTLMNSTRKYADQYKELTGEYYRRG